MEKKAQGEGWRAELLQENQQWSEILKQPNLDEEARTFYQQQIAVNDYHLEQNIRSTDGTMWDGVNVSANLIIVITIFTIIIVGDSVAGEFSSGTIKLLLIRPASRVKILVSKYISFLLFGMLLLLTLFVISVAVNGVLHGFGYMDLPLISMTAEGQIVERNMVLNLWKNVYAQWCIHGYVRNLGLYDLVRLPKQPNGYRVFHRRLICGQYCSGGTSAVRLEQVPFCSPTPISPST
ncbi:hypothetical protein GCM10020331_094990 [Ectobacillus funiculus]